MGACLTRVQRKRKRRMAATIYFDSHPLLSEHPPQSQQSFPLSPSLPYFNIENSGRPSGQSSRSKPLRLVRDMESKYATSLVDYEALRNAHDEDAALKARIRRLRLVSRVLTTLISLAVLVPLAMTLQKFLATQNTYRDVRKADGTVIHRTAWAKDTKSWPTYMYFLVAVVSVVLNFATLISYFRGGVQKANKAAHVATIFTWVVMLGNLVVWCVAAGLYRTEKDKDGKSNDLWGWTCSAGARAIQKEFANEVNFNRSCNVQSASWYIGLGQVGAALLTVIIYILVLMRWSSKKKLGNKRLSQMAGQYPSDY